jgi:hypothetical protein
MQGAVAQYGRGVVPDVANQLVGRFADCLADQLRPAAGAEPGAAVAGAEPDAVAQAPAAAPAAVKPVGGLGLVLRALLRPVLRLFGRA